MSLTTGIIAYWKLDGNSNDSVGSNNGTDTAITYSFANGKIIQGAGLNGSTSFISLPTGMNVSTGYSIAAWVYSSDWTAAGSANPVLCKTLGIGPATTSYVVYITTAGNVFNLWSDAGDHGQTSAGTLSTNTWHYVVCTYDGTNQKIYIDGTNTDTVGATGTVNSTTSGTSIGRLGGYAGAGFNASMNVDEVGLWNRALTGTEVTQLYNGGVGIQYPFTLSNSKFFMFI